MIISVWRVHEVGKVSVWVRVRVSSCACVCVGVCGCVSMCVWERERGRERNLDSRGVNIGRDFFVHLSTLGSPARVYE